MISNNAIKRCDKGLHEYVKGDLVTYNYGLLKQSYYCKHCRKKLNHKS